MQALLDPARSRVPDLGQKSLLVWLRELNSPEALLANQRSDFDVARVGDSELQRGANWVGHWYARNLRIFDRLVRISSDPKSRVLAICGYGHAYLLDEIRRGIRRISRCRSWAVPEIGATSG